MLNVKSKMLKGNLFSISRFTFYIPRFSGQFLVEAMVAISIITIGLLGILALLSNATSLNRVVSDEYSATYLASEGIEVVKAIVDTNIINARPWNQGLSNGDFEVQYNDAALRSFSGHPLRYQGGIYGYDQGTDTVFYRTLTLELSGPDKINVTSHVQWVTRGGITFDVRLSDVFVNWR